MSKRCKYSAEQKLSILREYEDGKLTQEQICSKYEINQTTFRCWRNKFESYGLAGLNEAKVLKEYPLELRMQAVSECIEGRDSIRGVARKYGISSKTVLRG